MIFSNYNLRSKRAYENGPSSKLACTRLACKEQRRTNLRRLILMRNEIWNTDKHSPESILQPRSPEFYNMDFYYLLNKIKNGRLSIMSVVIILKIFYIEL